MAPDVRVLGAGQRRELDAHRRAELPGRASCSARVSTLADPPVVVRAAGCAVWRRPTTATLETALVHRPRYDDWSLPKGKPEAGEHLLQTAAREVAEETGLEIVVGTAQRAHLLRRRRPRRRAGPQGGRLLDRPVDRRRRSCANDEADDLRWLPLDDAAALCSHEHDRAVLADLARTDVPRAPTLVLRAARARRLPVGLGRPRRPAAARLARARRGAAAGRGAAAVRPADGVQRAAGPLPGDRGARSPSAWASTCSRCPSSARRGSRADPEAGLATVERLLEPPRHARRHRRLQPGRGDPVRADGARGAAGRAPAPTRPPRRAACGCWAAPPARCRPTTTGTSSALAPRRQGGRQPGRAAATRRPRCRRGAARSGRRRRALRAAASGCSRRSRTAPTTSA